MYNCNYSLQNAREKTDIIVTKCMPQIAKWFLLICFSESSILVMQGLCCSVGLELWFLLLNINHCGTDRWSKSQKVKKMPKQHKH